MYSPSPQFYFLIILCVSVYSVLAAVFQLQVDRGSEGHEDFLVVKTDSRPCEIHCNKLGGAYDKDPVLLLYSADTPSDATNTCKCRCRGANATFFGQIEKCSSLGLIGQNCYFFVTPNQKELPTVYLTEHTTKPLVLGNLKIRFCNNSISRQPNCPSVSKCMLINGFYENFGWKPLWSEENEEDFGIGEGGQLKVILKRLQEDTKNTSLEFGSCNVKTLVPSSDQSRPKTVEGGPTLGPEKTVAAVTGSSAAKSKDTTTKLKITSPELKHTAAEPRKSSTESKHTTAKSKNTTTKLKQTSPGPRHTTAEIRRPTSKPQKPTAERRDTSAKPRDTTGAKDTTTESKGTTTLSAHISKTASASSSKQKMTTSWTTESSPSGSERPLEMSTSPPKAAEPNVLHSSYHDSGGNNDIVIGIAGVVAGIVFIMAIILVCMMHRRKVRSEKSKKTVDIVIEDFESPPVTAKGHIDSNLAFDNAALEPDAEMLDSGDLSSGYASTQSSSTASQFLSLQDDSDSYSSSPGLNPAFLSDEQPKGPKDTNGNGRGRSFNEFTIRAQVFENPSIRLGQLKEIDEEDSSNESSECDVTAETYVGSLNSNKSLEHNTSEL